MENYIYTPNTNHEFRCRVPLGNTKQLFVVDGRMQDRPDHILAPASGGKGYNLTLGKGEEMEDLLQIISVRSGESKEDLSYGNAFLLGPSSRAKLLLCSHTLSEHTFTTTESLSITLEEDAVLDLVVMQNEHNHSSHSTDFNITLGARAVIKMHLITLHGGQISNTIKINLNGKKAECELNGLYLANGSQQISNVVNLSHRVPECRSNQLFKGILEENAITRFSGTILVAKDAQKTEAYQANNNLLASDTAHAYTQPHLEIYADDVKCSHGATIGSLDEQELFYMRSRGIPLNEARLLQQQAFAYAVLSKISNGELLGRLNDLVERRLRGEFSHCGNCSKHCC